MRPLATVHQNPSSVSVRSTWYHALLALLSTIGWSTSLRVKRESGVRNSTAARMALTTNPGLRAKISATWTKDSVRCGSGNCMPQYAALCSHNPSARRNVCCRICGSWSGVSNVVSEKETEVSSLASHYLPSWPCSMDKSPLLFPAQTLRAQLELKRLPPSDFLGA